MLEGKRVIVIAGSSGIGAEVARQSVQRGAHVTITGRDPDRLKSAAASMPEAVETAAFDATHRPSVIDFFARQSYIDHLVSCVGFTERGTLLDHEEERARLVFENKIWAQLFIVRSAHDRMAADGSIVLTGGTSEGRAVFPHFSAFSVVANTALGALAKGLAGELAPIRVNVVEPTMTDTPLLAEIPPEQKAELFARFSVQSPIGRVPQPRDVARSYLHLMESGLVNGDRIRPDGGPTYSGF